MSKHQGSKTISTTSYSFCNHSGEKDDLAFAVALGKRVINFYGARTTDIEPDFQHCSLYISMNGSRILKQFDGYIKSDTTGRDFTQYVIAEDANEIVVDCTDMSAPRLKYSFWVAVREYLTDETKFERVVCGCMGGHGRTGTALCALFMTFFKATSDFAISYVRRMYCDKVVESQSQIDYLDGLSKWYIKNEAELQRGKAPTMPKKKVKTQTTTYNTTYSAGPLKQMCDICGQMSDTAQSTALMSTYVLECFPCYKLRQGLKKDHTNSVIEKCINHPTEVACVIAKEYEAWCKQCWKEANNKYKTKFQPVTTTATCEGCHKLDPTTSSTKCRDGKFKQLCTDCWRKGEAEKDDTDTVEVIADFCDLCDDPLDAKEDTTMVGPYWVCMRCATDPDRDATEAILERHRGGVTVECDLCYQPIEGGKEHWIGDHWQYAVCDTCSEDGKLPDAELVEACDNAWDKGADGASIRELMPDV